MNILKIIKLKLQEKREVKSSFITCLLFFLISLQLLYSEEIFDFGVSLYNENDYYRAISEFDRYLFYFPKGEKVNDAYLYIVKSYYFAEQYQHAIQSAENFSGHIKNQEYNNILKFYIATSYLRSEKYDKSRDIYLNLVTEKIPNKIGEYSFYRLAWVDIFQTKWQDAYNKLSEFEQKYGDSKLVYQSKLLKDEVKKGMDFTPLSPTLAAIMSVVIPGAGQVYCKRAGDGIVALLLVGALSYSSYYYYNNGPSEMFYGSLFFNILFYLGNIYTAYGSAHKYNINFQLKLRESIFNNFYEDYNF